MNVQHPDMIRQGVPQMHQSLINQSFYTQPQQGQQASAHNMGPFQNNQATNPAALGLIGGQPGVSNPAYALSMQQGQPVRRQPMFMGGPHANPSGLNPNAGAGAGPSHLPGLAPGQIPNMAGFSAGMMAPSQQLRRVPSQPLNQTGAHMPGMQPGMMGGGGMGLNGPPTMNGLRGPVNSMQQQQMQLQMRQQQQQQQQQQAAQQPVQGGAMSPEMGLPMNRPTHMQGAGPMQQQHVRTASGQAQLMPGSMAQHGMAQQMGPNAFGNPMSLPPHQQHHQQSQLGTSSHVGGSGQPHPNMPGGMGGNQLTAANRAQMPADSSIYMNFSNQLQNQQAIQPPISHGVPRPPIGTAGTQFNVDMNFGASPTPPNPGSDMQQRGNPSMVSSGPTQQSLMTPAQALNKMSAGTENFPAGAYGMGQPPITAPQRPPSQHSPHNAFPMPQSQPPHPPQQSPRQADRLAGQMHPPPGMMQRPQSQPQVAHRQSPIPPGPSRTPRVSHTPLPMNSGGMMPPGRGPSAPAGAVSSPQGPAHQQTHPPASAPPTSQPMQIAPRPPSAAAAAAAAAAANRTGPAPPAQPAPTGQQAPAAESGGPPPPGAPPPGPASAPATASAPAQPLAPPRPTLYPVGFGQAMCRILQLSGSLAVDHKDRLKQSYWTNVVTTYFTEKATMKLTLWKDNQRSEAKPFEIGFPILSRFFLVTSQSGVKSMSISIDGARERVITPSHALVECATASWTFQYTNGYNITLRGPLTADVVVQPHASSGQQLPPNSVSTYTLKLERLQFDAFVHEKFLSLDSISGERIAESPRGMPASPGQTEDPNRFDEAKYVYERATIPAEPINAFGIPQATMRCLELAESVAQMSELIQYSIDTKMGPVDALAAFADKIRAARATHRGPPLPGLDGTGLGMHTEGSSAFDGHGMNGVNGAPSAMFMHNTANVAGPSQGPSTATQPQNASQADGVDVKPPKGTPQSAQASGSTPAASASTPASAPTPGGPTTPSMTNASLKRKAPPGAGRGEDSPTTSNAEQQPAAKRASRKRGRTQGGP
ncbi:hypothetical protein ONZ51_g198 [Trametes cubensis]|uniref:Uncharacterized protein n=1 Tax=Trametes cubensis TaxID=1111947 RepID=A0AAD7U4E5_9APHY|nr:hypothetical protein ONZ51_g198 [Trametes cubensis]